MWARMIRTLLSVPCSLFGFHRSNRIELRAFSHNMYYWIRRGLVTMQFLIIYSFSSVKCGEKIKWKMEIECIQAKTSINLGSPSTQSDNSYYGYILHESRSWKKNVENVIHSVIISHTSFPFDDSISTWVKCAAVFFFANPPYAQRSTKHDILILSTEWSPWTRQKYHHDFQAVFLCMWRLMRRIYVSLTSIRSSQQHRRFISCQRERGWEP